MKGQDIVVAMKIVSTAPRAWTFARLAHAVGLSPSEAHASVGRLRASGLLHRDSWRLVTPALAEFLVHGLPCVFPAVPGCETIGIATASSVESVRLELGLVPGQRVVWPYAGGSVRGHSVQPLYGSAPRIVLRDRTLHELLALIDCLRIGRTRERALAARALVQRIGT